MDDPLPQLESSARLRGAVTSLGLTPRESELVRLVAIGFTTDEICQQLGISLATLRTHLRNVYASLGITGRAQLVAVVLCRVLELDS